MNFQQPGALAWLLPLGGVIVALYLLRMRRKDFLVPATFLWPERQDEVRANSLFQRLRFNWLMILQLLALALLVFGLARWQVREQGLAGKVTVVVLDTSASMKASDVAPNRFAVAVAAVREMVAKMQAGDQMALISAGPSAKVIFPLSDDPARMNAALKSLACTDSESDLGEALRLGTALVGGIDGSKIVLVSDGCAEPVENFSPGKSELLYQMVGTSGNNLAIQALGTAEGQDGRSLYVGVKNFGSRQAKATVTVYSDGNPLFSSQAIINANSTWGSTVSAPAGANLYQAKVTSDDLLKADNEMVIPASEGASLRVLLLTQGNLFLERALSLDPRVTLDRAESVPETVVAGSPGKPVYDLVVFDGPKEVAVKAKAVLNFGSAGPASPVTATGQAKKPSFYQAESHRIVADAGLDSVYIDQCEKVSPKGGAKVLADGSSGPLVVYSQGAVHQIYVAFRPLESDWPLQTGFPVFIGNVLDTLATDTDRGVRQVRTGQSVSFLATEQNTLPVRLPGGQTLQIRPTGGRYYVRAFESVGKYVVGGSGSPTTVYANLRSDTESAIQPNEAFQAGGGSVVGKRSTDRFADLWKPLAILALLVLCGEWLLFARRS